MFSPSLRYIQQAKVWENLEEGGVGDNEARAFRLRESASSPAHLTCSQITRKSVPFLNTDVWSKELLWAITKSGKTQQEHTPDKVAPAPLFPRAPVCSPHRPTGSVTRQVGRALEQDWWV